MLSLCFTAYLRKSSLHSLSFLYNISQPNAVSPWSPIWHRKLTMLTLFPFPKLIFSSASYFNWPHFGIWLWPLPLAWRFNLYLVSLCVSSDWLTVPSSSYLLHLILLLHATTMQNSYRWLLLSSSLRTGFPQWASSELNKDKPWKWEYFYESLDRSNKTNWNAFFWELQTTYGYLAAVFHNYHGSETDGFQSNWGHCESRMGIVQVIMSQRLLPLP